MPARTQPARGLLAITFTRDGEEPETHQAIDGARAAATAITMIAARLTLLPGDTITCYRADDKPPADPETSRASHYS
jgi:hypothetical protein